MYRTLSMPAAPLARPSLPWSKRVLHQIVRRFDLDQNVRWRRLAGGRWARFTLVEPNTTEAPDDLHDRVVRRYGDDSNASWAKAMRPQWHPMLGCPCIVAPPTEVCPHCVLARDCACGDCRCEVWP